MARAKPEDWKTEDGLLLIRGWARDGLTQEDIANNIGVSRVTLLNWRKRYPEIEAAVMDGKEKADRVVENALYKRATGYSYEEVFRNEDGKVVKRVTKDVAPDVTAAIFWLKNRKPEFWRDRKEVAVDADIDASAKAMAEYFKSNEVHKDADTGPDKE